MFSGCCDPGFNPTENAEFLAAMARLDGSAEEAFEDFTAPGAYTTGAAVVPTGVPFGGSRSFRSVFVGAGAGTNYVGTNLTAQHHGIIECLSGTTAAGAAAGVAFPSGLVTRILGPNQLFKWAYGARLSVLSDGAQTYSARWGWSNGTTAIPADGWYIEADVTANANWRGVSRVGGVSTFATGGASVPIAINTWYLLRSTWDGATLRFFVKPEGGANQFIGQTTTVTTATMAEMFQIVKSVGIVSRSIFTDLYAHRLLWRAPRF